MEHYPVPRSDIWLADTDYANLPDFNGSAFIEGTRPTVEITWHSPLVNKSLTKTITQIRDVPKPPKAVCKTFFAVLQRELYEQRGMVLVCKVVEGASEP